MPMAYLAKMTGAAALWQEDTSNVMFIDGDAGNYISDNGMIRRDKECALTYDFFMNGLTDSALYLKSDGYGIGDLSAELGEEVRSVSRISDMLYFTDAALDICRMREGTTEKEKMMFYDAAGAEHDIGSRNVIAVRGRLWGVAAENADGSGRLFTAASDGSDFRYITDIPVYNLFMNRNGYDCRLFYGEAENRSVIHMIDMRTADDYTIEVTDYEHNNMLTDMEIFTVGDRFFAYIDSGGALKIVKTDVRPEDIEIIRIMPDFKRTVTEDMNGVGIGKIVSLNYDYINKVLYVVNDIGDVFYYTRDTDRFLRLDVFPGLGSISIFCDLGYRNIIAGYTGDAFMSKFTVFDGKWVNYSE